MNLISSSLYLQHHHLGHASITPLKFLVETISEISFFCNKHSYVCSLAKPTRISFNPSCIYIVKPFEFLFVVANIVMFSHWQNQLESLSIQIQLEYFTCYKDVCPLAKPSRISFNPSCIRIFQLFKLIPHRVPSHSNAHYFFTMMEDSTVTNRFP